MQAQETAIGAAEPSGPAEPLKWVEFELALGSADLSISGFDACVRDMASECDLDFLFELPVQRHEEVQRVAAIAHRAPDAPADIRFVTLSTDGATMRLDTRCTSLAHAEDLAHAYAELIIQ